MIDIRIKHRIFGPQGLRPLEVEYQVEEGSVVHLTGKSGIGKTTLFHAVAGLLKPDDGFIQKGNKVFLDTANNLFLTPQERNLALMFQQYALFPNMTLKQNVAFAQKTKSKAEVNALLEAFGLSGLENRYPSELSGGQQQRTALARALAQKADILMLDEPFSAVDEAMHPMMTQEILKFREETGATVFIISHYANGLEHWVTDNLHLPDLSE